jgi:Smr domain
MTRQAHIALHRAFDEARFGPARTLDLRASLPSAAEAVRRAEPWLRERQMAKAGDVLVVTGRGKGSPGGVAVVREAVQKLLGTLKRKGVVASVGEHTAGSFVVTLAPLRALFETVPRTRIRDARPAPADPAELRALAAATRLHLRSLAERSLDVLGAPRTEGLVHDEMVRQFAILSSAVAPDETDREGRLQFLIEAARSAFDDD